MQTTGITNYNNGYLAGAGSHVGGIAPVPEPLTNGLGDRLTIPTLDNPRQPRKFTFTLPTSVGLGYVADAFAVVLHSMLSSELDGGYSAFVDGPNHAIIEKRAPMAGFDMGTAELITAPPTEMQTYDVTVVVKPFGSKEEVHLGALTDPQVERMLRMQLGLIPDS